MSEERNWTDPNGSNTAGSLKFVKPAELASEGIKGVILEGEFVGPLVNNFDENKSDYKFLTDDETTVIVNHTGSLAYGMSGVKPGDYCQISYLGKEKLKSGKMKGKEAHMFKVLVDKNTEA